MEAADEVRLHSRYDVGNSEDEQPERALYKAMVMQALDDVMHGTKRQKISAALWLQAEDDTLAAQGAEWAGYPLEYAREKLNGHLPEVKGIEMPRHVKRIAGRKPWVKGGAVKRIKEIIAASPRRMTPMEIGNALVDEYNPRYIRELIYRQKIDGVDLHHKKVLNVDTPMRELMAKEDITRLNQYQISEKTGLTWKQVWHWCRRNGVPIATPPPIKSPIARKMDALQELRDVSKMTAKEIAEEIGVSEKRVWDWCRRHKVTYYKWGKK
jgi:hypothetical protein